MIRSVSFIGAGKVATALADALHSSGIEIMGVCSPSESAKKLAGRFGTIAVNKASELPVSDLCLVCVNDEKVSISQEGLPSTQPRAHSSGSVPMSVLSGDTIGVFYPLQTFSIGRKVDWSKVYFCLEASNKEFLEELSELAAKISTKQVFIDGEKRKKIHLAAVFACNFSNAMYSIAQKLLERDELSFEMLHPLIEETARKATLMSPLDAQTGPAQREDRAIIAQHKKALEKDTDLSSLYELITEYIIAQKNEEL